jgi:hypothetical protein
VPYNRRLTQLEESIQVYEQVIRGFEATRQRMRERRRGASDSVMVHIDEMLTLNERTLTSLNGVLKTAREQLRAERLRDGPP